jgi:homopolymeric O-antigen transport system permease protein
VNPLAPAPFVMRPSRGWVSLNLVDLWEYRELLAFLIWRDLKTRYKQTLLGPVWAIIQPLVTMVLFTVVFGWLARMPSDGLPYPIFSYCALLPWQLFSRALNAAGGSVVGSASLLTKVYFPRLVIPLSAVCGLLVDFAMSFVVLLGMMAYYRITPTTAIVTLPLLVLLTVTGALGAGLWVAALSVRYKDLRLALPHLIQLWLLATPVAFPSSAIPERWRLLVALNPMAGIVEGFRWALLGSVAAPLSMLALSGGIALGLLLTGLYLFRRMERTFADLV